MNNLSITTYTQIIRRLLLTLIVSTYASVSFAELSVEGQKESIVSVANATGQSYQFASHCGADANLLKQYRARFLYETTKGRIKLYPSLNIDIDAEFKVGQDVADQYYDAVKSGPGRAQVCNQTTELIQSLTKVPLNLPSSWTILHPTDLPKR